MLDGMKLEHIPVFPLVKMGKDASREAEIITAMKQSVEALRGSNVEFGPFHLLVTEAII